MLCSATSGVRGQPGRRSSTGRGNWKRAAGCIQHVTNGFSVCRNKSNCEAESTCRRFMQCPFPGNLIKWPLSARSSSMQQSNGRILGSSADPGVRASGEISQSDSHRRVPDGLLCLTKLVVTIYVSGRFQVLLPLYVVL